MPRLTKRVPSYRLHAGTGQAVVTLNGKDIYLGKYDTPQSREQYGRLIAEWLTANRTAATGHSSGGSGTSGSALTISELLLQYLQFAESYYVKNGQPTGE